MDFNNFNKALGIAIKTAQATTTRTDPVFEALNKANIGPGTAATHPSLMNVIMEMAKNGVPPNTGFNIGLAIGANKKPVFNVKPKNSIVTAALEKHVSPLIVRAIKNVPLNENWEAHQWVENLYWTS